MNKDAIRKHHDLKSLTEHFLPVLEGLKTFEIRRNDRDFQVGDSVTLHEYDPATNTYSGASLSGLIGYIDSYEQKEGYVVLSLVLRGLYII
jgi:hypothetical protein